MMKRGGLSTEIQRMVNDPSRSLGARLAIIRAIVDEAQKAERQLLMQVGCDLAKHMLALGINPTGAPVGETLKSIEQGDS